MNMVNETHFFSNFTYLAFGLIIGSKIELPLITSSQKIIDVHIKLGTVPTTLDNPVFISPLAMVKPGEAIIHIPNIAKYHIRSGQSINIEMASKSSLEDVIIFLLGSAMSAIFHQRGMLPLHASSAYYKNKAILIAGKSGSGKSTLITELLKRGLMFMSDDITAIHMINKIPMAAPSYPRMKLWDNSFDLLNLEVKGRNRIRKKMDKYYFNLEGKLDQTNRVVSHIFNLSLVKGIDNFSLEELDKLNAISAVSSNTYRYKSLKPHNNLHQHLLICSALASNSKIYQIKRNPFKNSLNKLADQIETIVKTE